MKLFITIFVLLLVTMTGITAPAQTRERICIPAQNSGVQMGTANSNLIAGESARSYYKRILLQPFVSVKTAYNKRAFINSNKRVNDNVLRRLVCSNLQLTFRLSKTFKLKLSYI
ncbi:MAG: hypothetical protein V4635_13705 [Bacteroidota bacterium]